MGRASARPRFYRRKATFQAMQWTADAESTSSVTEWFGEDNVRLNRDKMILILRGATEVYPDQWIVLSPNNRLHICVPGLFEEVHELALSDPEDKDVSNWAAHAKAQRSAASYWKKMAKRLAKDAGAVLAAPPPMPDGVEITPKQ